MKKELKQTSSSKVSRTWLARLELIATIDFGWLRRPQTIRVDNGHIVGNYNDQHGQNDLIFAEHWERRPHVELANLVTYNKQERMTMKPESDLRIDVKSVQKFVRTFGGFEKAYLGQDHFDQDIKEIALGQSILRMAWLNMPIEGRTAGFNFDPYMGNPPGSYKPDFYVSIVPEHYDRVLLATYDLWILIKYLFLLDHTAHKTGVCGYPDCPAPYFLKRRKDQKFCERGSCTAYAQRQYALKWWRDKGERKRAKMRAKPTARKGR
jgi:hypothetical protein